MTDSTPPEVLILQHVRPEPPGTIAEALNDCGVSHRTVQLFRDDPVPDTLDADGLVVMGGPMGVGDLDDRPAEGNRMEGGHAHRCRFGRPALP